MNPYEMTEEENLELIFRNVMGQVKKL